LGGCLAGGVSKPSTASVALPDRPPPDLSSILPVLEMMSSLPAGDPARQAEQFQATKDAAELAPTTSNKLKYALALATPGHSGADPVAAQRQLSELLASPETLLPVERLLALVELREVEQQLVLQSENKRMRDEATHDSHDKLLAVNRRLAAESDENARLRKALDEALAKLEAVTHIERSINDRGASEPRTP
jgi:predicted O-linked N-acetylglucosamine transferase (SPINDLY family)